MEDVDCVVIGAGVVGLAVARALARRGREVLVLERADSVGTEASSRNSEVLHAGIYYPLGSLKARLCRQGKEALYAFCGQRGVAHHRCGKLIVASHPSQIPALEGIRRNAEANGVTDLAWLDAGEARSMEPALQCERALFSPSTGILSSHELMVALWAEAQTRGAILVTRHPVLGGRISEKGVILRVGGRDPTELRCRVVVNSAGFRAPAVARSLEGFPVERVPRGHLCKGSYFTLARRAPFRHLVYPAPEEAGLGIHLTLDLGGMARFGPDVEWVETVDYRVDPARVGSFYQAVRRYWPELPAGSLRPGFAGIRAKIQAPGEPAADFAIRGPADHGVSGLVHLFGIESPGLTACLTLAEEVASRLA